MAVREPLKDEAYLKKVYHHYEKEAAVYNGMLKNKSPEVKRWDNLHLLQTGHYFYWLRAAYSIGKPVQELVPLYDALIDHWHAYYTWPGTEPDLKVNINSYLEALQFCSLGILLQAKDETLDRLKTVMQLMPVDLVLAEFSGYLKTGSKQSNKLFFKKSFEPLLGVFDAPAAQEKETALKSFLAQWMRLLKPVVYTGSHLIKVNDTAFAGYWSFEAAAICVMENLNAAAFKDTKFFPYDLLNYRAK